MPKIEYCNGNWIEYEIKDCIGCMMELEDESIDCVITSPPYFNATHEYQRKGGYHYTKDYGEVLFVIEDASKEILRLLKPNGTYFLNLGFSYGETGVLRPFWIVDRLVKQIGFFCQDIVIWKKLNPIPLKNRLTNAYEYVFVLSKTPVWKYKKEMNYELNVWEFNVIFQNQYRRYNQPHGAMFPIELPLKCIDIATKQDDLILDPFLGSGTTLEACHRTNRNGIGFEINPEYEPTIRKRIMVDIPSIESYK